MCLIALAWKAHADFPLLLVANRDEFHQRPAAPLAWWDDQPRVLAGRDLQENGTWLGASRCGRVAAVTNVRGPDAMLRGARSRGALVADFLAGHQPAVSFAQELRARAAEYGGFNLLLHEGDTLLYVSNRPDFLMQRVEPGVHTLSNAQLDTPWPKARLARSAMEAWLERALEDEAALLGAMTVSRPAADAELPQTGVGQEMERVLSSAFIRTPAYGTRCTTLLRLAATGETDVFERRYSPRGKNIGESRQQYRAERSPGVPAGHPVGGGLSAAADRRRPE